MILGGVGLCGEKENRSTLVSAAMSGMLDKLEFVKTNQSAWRLSHRLPLSYLSLYLAEPL